MSLRSQLGDDGSGHSPILGWAFDGYPIYGPYGYAKLDGNGDVVRLASSYQLKQGTRPSGPGGAYDGSYIEDYEYVAGSGSLDEHNGRFAITPEYPEGTYYYVVTIDANGDAAYPTPSARPSMAWWSLQTSRAQWRYRVLPSNIAVMSSLRCRTALP